MSPMLLNVVIQLLIAASNYPRLPDPWAAGVIGFCLGIASVSVMYHMIRKGAM